MTHLFPAISLLLALVPAGLLLTHLPVDGRPLLHDGDLGDPFLDKSLSPPETKPDELLMSVQISHNVPVDPVPLPQPSFL